MTIATRGMFDTLAKAIFRFELSATCLLFLWLAALLSGPSENYMAL